MHVFVRSYTEIEGPFNDVVSASARMEPAWIRGHVFKAELRMRDLLAEHHLMSRKAETGRVKVSSWRLTPDSASIHLTWSPPEPRSAPWVDAELELAPVGTRRTQLSFSGQYQPPDGWHGDGRLLLRLAERVAGELTNDLQVDIVAGLHRTATRGHDQAATRP